MSLYNNYIISKSDASKLDKITFENKNIPPIILMEEASEKIYQQLLNDFKNIKNEKIALLAGWGNNGGDTLSLARKLFFNNIIPDIYIFNKKDGTELYQIHKNILSKMNITFKDINSLKENIHQYTLLIDGIFGIGYKERDDKDIFDIINLINNSNAVKVSIDTPSGISGKNCIKADFTYSVGYLKTDFFNINNREYAGKIKDLKISFDINDLNQQNNTIYVDNIFTLKKIKNDFVHKYKRGSCLLIGGAEGKFGSIIMSGESAYSCGAGIVLELTEKENIADMNLLSKSIIFDEYKNYEKYSKKYNTILIGPGVDFINIKNKEKIIEILNDDKQFILDASFFSFFTPDDLLKLKRPPILTPHSQELINFFKKDAEDIKSDTIKILNKISVKYNCYILLKDSFMILSCPDNNNFIFDYPSRVMAQAGSGDILAGIITGIISQGYDCLDSILESIRVFKKVKDKLNYKYSYSPERFIELLRDVYNETD